MGATFFLEGVKIFFMCTWVKNTYRGGDVLGCHSLGEEGSKGGEKIFNIKKNNYFFLNNFFQSFASC